MKINVNKDKILINDQYYINQGEININELEFDFSSEYEGLVKKAIFKNSEKAVEKTIFENICTIPPEVLTEDRIELRVYAYDSQMNLRYSPTYILINVEKGSYMEGTIPPKVITPSQFEQYEAELNKGLKQAENVNISQKQISTGVEITTTDRNGKQTTAVVLNGPEGPQGPQGEPGVTPDLTDYVKNTDYATVTKGGVIKVLGSSYNIAVSNGALYALANDYTTYQTRGNGAFIGKGTLENVIAGKRLNTSYSTDETVVGTYLDKDIYRKVLQITSSEYTALDTTSSRKKLPLNINIDNILRADIITQYNDGTKLVKKSYPMHMVNTGNSYDQGAHIYEDGFLQIYVGSNILNGLIGNINIVLEYTKN